MQFGKNKKTTAISATRLGNFLKFLATNLYTKVAQLYDDNFEKHLLFKMWLLLGQLVENWATFYSNIWSH